MLNLRCQQHAGQTFILVCQKKKVKCCSNVNEGFVTPAASRAGEELRS